MLKQTFLTVLVLLACCVDLMEGMPSSVRERCLCNVWRDSVIRNRIAKTEYHQPTSRCRQEELIVTLRNKQRFCLNLNEEQGKRMKENFMNQKKAK